MRMAFSRFRTPRAHSRNTMTPFQERVRIMAKQVITLLTDDLDGGEADRTIEFGLDGVNYTIDLSEKIAGRLRKALEPYLSVATRVGRSAAADARGGRRGAVSTGRASRDQNQ